MMLMVDALIDRHEERKAQMNAVAAECKRLAHEQGQRFVDELREDLSKMRTRCICGSRLVGGYCLFSICLLCISLMVLGFVIVWRVL